MGHHLTAEDRNYWVIDWLSRQGPAEWHGLATAWDWEDGVEPLRWIIEQDACDRATALAIFWESDPEYFLSEDGIETPIGEMDEEIAARWKAGQYKTHLFSYDPAEQADLPEESHVNDVITIDMGMAVTGSERAPNYSYGLPEEIEAAWNEANGVVERPVWSPEEDELEDEDGAPDRDWSVSAAPDFSVPDFAASASAAITSASAAISGATYDNGVPVSPQSVSAHSLSAHSFSSQSGADEAEAIEPAADHPEPDFSDAIFANEPEPFADELPAEPPVLEIIEEPAAEEPAMEEPAAIEDIAEPIMAEPIFDPPSTFTLPSTLFTDDHDDEEHDALAPPSLAAYAWKSKPPSVAPVEVIPLETEPLEAEAATEEPATEPATKWPVDVAPQEIVAEFEAEDAYQDIAPEAGEEEIEPLPYEDVSFAAIDYDSPPDSPMATSPIAPLSGNYSEDRPAYHNEPQEEPVFAAHAPIFDDVTPDEFSTDDAHIDPYADGDANADVMAGVMVQDEGADTQVAVAPHAAEDEFAEDFSADFAEEETSTFQADDRAPDDEESEEGEEASFAYDLKSMFAPPAPATPASKFGTAVRMPNPDVEPHIPTEAELAARAAAVEAEAQVSSRIRSLRHGAIEEAQQAQQSASSGLMGKMRSMLGR